MGPLCDQHVWPLGDCVFAGGLGVWRLGVWRLGVWRLGCLTAWVSGGTGCPAQGCLTDGCLAAWVSGGGLGARRTGVWPGSSPSAVWDDEAGISPLYGEICAAWGLI